jgi:cytochrome P450
MTTEMPALTDDQTELLAWLRDMRHERPLWQGPNGVYNVYRHDDVHAALADPARFSSNLGRVMPFIDPAKVSGNLTWTDPPAHRALRQLVGQAFTPRTIAALRPAITTCAGELAAATGDEFDFVTEFASPLPITIIAQLLGVSPTDRDFFRDNAERSLGLRLTKDQTQEERAALVANATKDLDAYLLSHIHERRARPADDLLGKLTAAELDGRHLADMELVSFATLLLNAGFVTTTLLLANFLLCLREDASAESRLRDNRAAIPQAIEEALRHRPAIAQITRIANEGAEIGGVTIPENSFVGLSVMSANHDETQFTNPDQFDIDRNPGGHIAFGHGIHFCLGAPLARLEAEIAINALFDEYKKLEISGKPTYDGESQFYGPKTLEIKTQR